MCRNKQKLARMLQEIREIEEQQTKLLKQFSESLTPAQKPYFEKLVLNWMEQLEESKRLTEERWEKLMGKDLIKIILYGSCSRGDYTQESDIDIVLLTNCDRIEVKKYNDGIASISTKLAMKYFSVVNFVCLPYEEFQDKKEWYPYFRNIEEEGEVIYG